jgi:hypothetical protein
MAPSTTEAFGPYGTLPGVAVQAITIDVNGGSIWRVSPVASVVFQ